jgi:flagellar hook-length control protein FliK
MTIEAGPKPNGVRTAAADNRNQKNNSAAADSAGGGFGAILASMDSSEKLDPPIAEVVDASAGTPVLVTSPEPSVTLPDSASKGLVPADTPTNFETGKGTDFQLKTDINVLSELGEDSSFLPENPTDAIGLVTSPTAEAASASISPSADAAALLSQTAHWPFANAQSSRSDGQKPVENAVQLGAIGTTPVHTASKSQIAPGGLSDLDVPLASLGKSGKLQRDFAAKQAQLPDVLTEREPLAGREIESRLPSLAATSVEQSAGSIAVNLAATGSLVPVRRDDPTRERSVFRSNASEGSVFAQSYLSTSSSTTVQYTPQLQMSTDVFVAEKVAYWISNDVQNAELKLDGIGLDPVEVSIRMHGNEAHVAFRTDELQARAALENASTHLKELLQREGLVLTGVSVGTAGAGDSGDREGKPRQGNRQTNISVISELPARSGSVTGRSTGGRLDLFV